MIERYDLIKILLAIAVIAIGFSEVMDNAIYSIYEYEEHGFSGKFWRFLVIYFVFKAIAQMMIDLVKDFGRLVQWFTGLFKSSN